MATHTPPTEEDLRVFKNAINSIPMETFFEVAGSFSMRELLSLAEEERFAEFAHGELYGRALALVHRFKLLEVATLEMMDREHTVMSGSAALSVTAPGLWTPSDIDFYCPDGKLEAVVEFLTAFEYEVVPWPAKDVPSVVGDPSASTGDDTTSNESSSALTDTDSTDSSDEDIADAIDHNPYARHVMKTVLLLKHKSEGCTLNVIESVLPCAEAAIFGFHSTVVMNVVTSKGATCFYPQWTFFNKGVVNRPDGIANWKVNDEEKEKAALSKYRDRGYAIAPDCDQLHAREQKRCDACMPQLKKWSDGTSMTFRRGDTFAPSGRPFYWRLGAQPRERQNMFWKDRGVLIVAQGDGDGRAFVYDGLAMQKKIMTAEGLRVLL